MRHTPCALLVALALTAFGAQVGAPGAQVLSAAPTVFISPEDVTLRIGQFTPLVVLAADGTPVHDVILTITEPSIAEIDSDAVHHAGARRGVRGRAPGTTVVTASTSKGVAQASVRVVGKNW